METELELVFFVGRSLNAKRDPDIHYLVKEAIALIEEGWCYVDCIREVKSGRVVKTREELIGEWRSAYGNQSSDRRRVYGSGSDPLQDMREDS